ncbi:hypothetical protein Btru_047004 [Bulinus truncatus]|nr:hypothetical protein Btru_047004 [Bulinus truncatus]
MQESDNSTDGTHCRGQYSTYICTNEYWTSRDVGSGQFIPAWIGNIPTTTVPPDLTGPDPLTLSFLGQTNKDPGLKWTLHTSDVNQQEIRKLTLWCQGTQVVRPGDCIFCFLSVGSWRNDLSLEPVGVTLTQVAIDVLRDRSRNHLTHPPLCAGSFE